MHIPISTTAEVKLFERDTAESCIQNRSIPLLLAQASLVSSTAIDNYDPGMV